MLIDDHWRKEYVIEEPLVTAGFFDYGRSELDGDWEWRYARLYGYLQGKQNLEANGVPHHFTRETVPSFVKGKFESGEVFAVPLVSVKNDSDVSALITERLLKLFLEKNNARAQ